MVLRNWESNGHQNCHIVTFNDDIIQNSISLENSNVQGPKRKKKQDAKISKVSTFNSKIPAEAPIFTRNKLYQDVKMIPTIGSIN